MPYKDENQQKQAQHESYLRNKEKVRKSSVESRRSRQRFVSAIKSYPCSDCGMSWPPCAMEFDHIDSKEKVASVSRLVMTRGMKIIVEEIMKCDLVCACCHALRTTNCKDW